MPQHFQVLNRRRSSVWLEDASQAGAPGSGELSAGGSRALTGNDGASWVAYAEAARTTTVGVYEVTPRVDLWEIFEPATGLPVALDRLNAGFYSESLDTPAEFLRPDHALEACFLFVDFDDATASPPWDDPDRIVDHLAAGAPAWVQRASLGRADLKITSMGSPWRRMPKKAAAYADPLCHCVSGASREYVDDATALFDQDVDFSAIDIVFVVAAKTPALALSPGWIALPPERPISRGAGTVRYAVCFGEDSYDPSVDERLLLHEMCHLFGLPDLYDGGAVENRRAPGNPPIQRNFSTSAVGPFDLMADQTNPAHLLAWHRLKLGWLHPSQVVCHYGGGALEIDLTGLGSPDGVKAVMVPVFPSDANKRASSTYVVEVEPGDTGVLVSTVDAGRETWNVPVRVRCGSDALQPGILDLGQIYGHLVGGIEVEVLSKLPGGGFQIRVAA